MFGHNEIVGQSHFAKAEGRLLVTSMFMTLQGEGPFSGCPAFFVRLAKCNLACSFCDTYFDSGDWFDPAQLSVQIHGRINDFFASHNGGVPDFACKWPGHPRGMVLVITGGEPTLQKNLIPFLNYMMEEGEFEDIQIESNGILANDYIPSEVHLVVSPKCLEKDRRTVAYLKPREEMLKRADSLKFVMSADPYSAYHKIPDWAFEWLELGRGQVFVSPMNVYNHEPKKAKELRALRQGGEITLEERSTIDEVVSFWEPGLLDMEANKRNHEYAANYCIRHGLRFNVQTHLLASVA